MKNTPLVDKNLSSEEEKLEHYQKKQVLGSLVDKLSKEDGSLYYMPTNQVAGIIHEMIQNKEAISHEQWEKVKNLSLEDIHILMSHKD
jgi:hypothetical protein